MIRTAVIIDTKSDDDTVGIFDTVTYYVEEDDCEEQVKIVTTLRRDPKRRIISKESPLGDALMGKKKGDRVCVNIDNGYNDYSMLKRSKVFQQADKIGFCIIEFMKIQLCLYSLQWI